MITKNLRIDLSKRFDKQLRQAPVKIKQSFKNRFIIFLNNPFNPLLNNHALTGKLSGRRSINITGDWRGIYSQYIDKNGTKVIVFEMLGTHSQIYR